MADDAGFSEGGVTVYHGGSPVGVVVWWHVIACVSIDLGSLCCPKHIFRVKTIFLEWG